MEFDLNNLPDLSSLDPEELRALSSRLEDLYREVEAQEPDDEECEEYDTWLDDLEEIEDLMDEIEEKVVYKNGKTILNFKNENLIDNFTTYEYVIDGVSSYGDTVEVEKNVDATLKVNTVIDFIEKSAQKEIKIDVVKVSNPIIDINEEGILNIVAGNIENDELKSIFYSINGENYKEFSEQETLKPGTYKIKAYQVSSATGIKSDEEEKEFTIEEKPVQEDIDYKEDKGQTVDKESQENDSSINEQNKNGVNSLNIPKTGDNIFIFIVLIISVIAINVMHNNKKK